MPDITESDFTAELLDWCEDPIEGPNTSNLYYNEDVWVCEIKDIIVDTDKDACTLCKRVFPGQCTFNDSRGWCSVLS